MPTGTNIVVRTNPAMTSLSSHAAWYVRRICAPGSQRSQPLAGSFGTDSKLTGETSTSFGHLAFLDLPHRTATAETRSERTRLAKTLSLLHIPMTSAVESSYHYYSRTARFRLSIALSAAGAQWPSL